MKEFCQELLQAINDFYPLTGSNGGKYIVGSFYYRCVLFSFMVSHRGCFQRMAKEEKTEWFDLAGTPRKYTAIIYNGVKYDVQPTLQL